LLYSKTNGIFASEIINGYRKGDVKSPFSLPANKVLTMIQSALKSELQEFALSQLVGTDLFVVDFKVLPFDKIEFFLDADSSVTIAQCTKLARTINKWMEEKHPEVIYELEVSSAGLEHPLQSLRQYKKNIGRQLEVMTPDGKMIEGKLLECDENSFTIEFQSPKAKHKRVQATFKYSETKEVLVGVSFN
jgi:ribosome maturation factor RimP